MAEVEINRHAGQDQMNDLYGSRLIHNKKLRGPNESFTDAMRQGEAALNEVSSAMITEMLKEASRR